MFKLSNTPKRSGKEETIISNNLEDLQGRLVINIGDLVTKTFSTLS